jgi:hypothetical protein
MQKLRRCREKTPAEKKEEGKKPRAKKPAQNMQFAGDEKPKAAHLSRATTAFGGTTGGMDSADDCNAMPIFSSLKESAPSNCS